ncbi:hypothetical protein IE53DRAFT_46245 [Violaceomyces palustris]|uniref:Uncharacterized protein n=1 Tax=Violaceomyces palustris TaxID=1673888 RepID=A0ACD0P0F8_9BASI|nr:hypothetical protein IE53DRAFT_46245 [Violaceomyces palustris]
MSSSAFPSRSTSLSMDRFSSSNSERRKSSSSRQRPLITSRPITLWTHEPPNFSTKEVVLSPDYLLPGLTEADLLELSSPEHVTTSAHNEERLGKVGKKRGTKATFVFRASQALADPDFAARQTSLQMSVSKSIASIYGFYNRSEAVLSKVSKEDNTIDHVELYFRDQYIGRADMWRFFQSMEDTCVYCGQKIVLAGSVRATIGRIFIKQKKVTSGYVSSSTKAIFRSESARTNLFIQMAREMWEFDEDGEIYYEKALQGFLPELLKRWRAIPTNHVLSVVLFARAYYDESELHMLEGPIQQDFNGRYYIDHCKVIVDLESNSDWKAVMKVLKEEFFRFQHDILLLNRPVAGPAASKEEAHAAVIRDRVHLAGRFSFSYEGNFLETVNLALNSYDEHYIDRDLNRTGLSMVFVTPGTGRFEVDKRLLRITTERMFENGIGIDLVCLTKMPLHSVPLFHFKSHIPDAAELSSDRSGRGNWSKKRGGPTTPRGGIQRASNQFSRPTLSSAQSSSGPPDPLYFDSKRPAKEETDFYSMPLWIDCSFYNLQQDKPFRADRFVPRCKMYELQMMGIMENQISNIAIPFLDLRPAHKASSLQSSFFLPRYSGPSGPSGSGFASDPTNSAISDLAIAGLSPREQRRAARERFDSEIFKDVDSLARPLGRATAGPIVDSPTISEVQRISNDRPELRRTQSSAQNSTAPSSISPVKQPTRSMRPTRFGRESGQASPVLESHAEDALPSSPEHRRLSLAFHDISSSTIGDDRKSASRPASQMDLQPSSSRPASIKSTTTFSRGVRPLEPIGKARALVAASDAVLSATSSYVLDESDPASQTRNDDPKERTPQKSKADSPTSSKGKNYFSRSWLWSTFTGATSTPSRDGRFSGASPSPANKDPLSGTRRIQDVLSYQLRNAAMSREQSPAKRGINSPGILSRSSSLLSVRESSAPSPISIPAQITPRTRLETETEERIFRDQDAYEQQLEEEEARIRYAQRAQVEKQTLVNPSNPTKVMAGNPSQLLRWQHLFPRKLNHHAVKWRSMTTPACLPLTTLYLPTENDLAAMWHEHPHMTSVSSETSSFLIKRSSSTHPALAVLREMVNHRLAQGYQFIVPAGKSAAASSRQLKNPKHFTLRQPSELLQPGNLSAGNPIFLSMTNQIHRISYDRSAGAINVKRFVRKTEYSTEPIDYKCCIWPRGLPGYQTVAAKFSYPDSGSYNWTYLDSLIAGYVEEKFVESLRYWRTRFVLVPSEGSPPPMKAPTGEDLSDEEIRLIGTDKLAELFWRARYHKNKEDRDQINAPRFLPTSLDPATSVHDEEFMKQMIAIEEEMNAQASARQSGRHSRRAQKTLAGRALEAIAKDMRSDGLKISDRLWNKINYADAFTGADLVTWLCMEYVDVRSREEAVEVGCKLQEDGLFEHVHKSHGFLDGHYFYRLKSEYAPSRHGKGWFRGGRSSHGEDDTSLRGVKDFSDKEGSTKSISQRRNASSGSGDSGGQVSHSRQPSYSNSMPLSLKRRRRIQMSRSLVIDVDPGRRSERAEVAFLHHDIAHNPANGFNFQIHWLGTTSRFIEDLVQMWTRTVEKYGLRLIEAPIGQIKDVTKHNPFQAPLQIELALPPPHPSTYAHKLPENTIADQYFEFALLRKWGFILDQEASNRYPKDVEIAYSSRPSYFEFSQFVHRSGVAFVQVLGGSDGFLWLNNRLFTSHLQVGNRQQGGGGGGGMGGIGGHLKGGGGGGGGGGFHGHRDYHQGQTAPDVEKIRKDFTAFCSSPAELENFYRQVLINLFDLDSGNLAGAAESGGGRSGNGSAMTSRSGSFSGNGLGEGARGMTPMSYVGPVGGENGVGIVGGNGGNRHMSSSVGYPSGF